MITRMQTQTIIGFQWFTQEHFTNPDVTESWLTTFDPKPRPNKTCLQLAINSAFKCYFKYSRLFHVYYILYELL